MSDFGIWRGRIDKCLAVQKKKEPDWKAAVDLYNCKYFDRIYGGFDPDRVDVHFANWYVSNLVPLVYFRDPFIFVKPRNDRFSAFAETMEECLNYAWRELCLKQQFKKVIMSSFLMPPGWLKVGYTAKIGQDVADIDKIKEKSLIMEIKNAFTGVFGKEKKSPEELGVLDMNISEESVFASWIPSWNMLMPPGYHLVSQMPYIVEIEDVSMTDFKVNPLYKNKKDVSPTRELSDKDTGDVLRKPSYTNLPSGKDNDDEIVRLYHVWDRRGQKRLTISDKDIHFEGKWPYDIDGFPYKPLIFEDTLPKGDESNPYPPNAIEPIFPQIVEQSQARTMMVKHRKRASAALLVQKGLLTEEEIDNLSESEVMQLITVSNLQAVTPLQLPPLDKSVFNVDEIIKQDLQMGTSMGAMMFQAQAGQRTATQASIAQSGLQLKAQARVDVVEDFTVSVARSLAQLMWQFYDRNRVTEIIGNVVTPNMWPELPKDPEERKRVIKAELSFKIDAGSTAPPKDESVDRKQLLDLASIVSTIAPERLNKGEFVKVLLKKFKFAKDLDRIVISSDNEEMMTAQEENQYMSQGMPQAVSPNENHTLHIQVHSQAAGNPIVDEHIVRHGQFLGIKETGNPMEHTGGGGQSGVGPRPQEGDMRPPTKSSNPELTRQGAYNEGDINQSTQNLGIGTGPEAK